MRQNAHRARQRRAPRGSPAAVETLTAVGRARVCAQICAHQKLRTKIEKGAPLQASRRRQSHPGSENCRSPCIRQRLVRVRGEKGQEKQSEVTAAERGPAQASGQRGRWAGHGPCRSRPHAAPTLPRGPEQVASPLWAPFLVFVDGTGPVSTRSRPGGRSARAGARL